jgi:hypothetical protein
LMTSSAMCSQLQLISKVNVSCRASIMHAIVVNCVVRVCLSLRDCIRALITY